MRFSEETGCSLAAAVRGARSGTVIELAPGRYEGPLVVERGLTLRGAGDLSRIAVRRGRGSVVRVSTPEPVVLESLLLEGGRSAYGAGIEVENGDVRLFNLQVRDCAADEAGGALHVSGGVVEAERMRLYDLRARRGGALAVERGALRVVLADAEIRQVEAEKGGALAISGCARVKLEGVTIARARASSQEGGQAVWISGQEGAVLELRRVRFGDAPIGRPLVNDSGGPATVSVWGCDLPRFVQDTPGLVVLGETRWR